MSKKTSPQSTQQSQILWNDARKKIVFALYYNIAMQRVKERSMVALGLNLWEPLEEVTIQQRKNEKQPHEAVDISNKVTELTNQLIEQYSFAHYLNKWNGTKAIPGLFQLLKEQRNFFSHAWHQPVVWQNDEMSALENLYRKFYDRQDDEEKEWLDNFPLFVNSNAGRKEILSFQGALFFVSLFLSRQDVNAMYDAFEQVGDLYFKDELIDDVKVYHLFQFYPGRKAGSFWAVKTGNSVVSDTIYIKRFYDIVNYLRKCPSQVAGSHHLSASVEKYKVRDADFFLHYASAFINEFNVFNRISLEPNSINNPKNIHHNNIDFRIYEQSGKGGSYLKGYMGKEVIKRLLIKILNNEPVLDLEKTLYRFMKSYYSKPASQIDETKYPVPKSIRLRKIKDTVAQFEIRDEMMCSRLRWVISKLERGLQSQLTDTQMANYITSRWNRWLLYHSIANINTNLTSLPEAQFTKIRALLTNYKNKKKQIIEELQNSRRYGGYLADTCEESNDLMQLFNAVLKKDMLMCKQYLKDDLKRSKNRDALAVYLNLKNPFGNQTDLSFSEQVPLAVNKKVFEGKHSLDKGRNIVELIDAYYPVATNLFEEGIEKNASLKKERRKNKSVWNIRQEDEILALLAVKYLEKGLSLKNRTQTISSFSLANLEDELAALNLKLSFKIGAEKLKANASKVINFSFDEYKSAFNRSILFDYKDLAFAERFNEKNELELSELLPEMYSFSDSQFQLIKSLMDFENKVLQSNPSQKNGKFVGFRRILELAGNKDEDLKYHLTEKPEIANIVDVTKDDCGNTFLAEFRNAAMHNHLPIVNGKLAENYFTPAVEFVERLLKN